MKTLITTRLDNVTLAEVERVRELLDQSGKLTSRATRTDAIKLCLALGADAAELHLLTARRED